MKKFLLFLILFYGCDYQPKTTGVNRPAYKYSDGDLIETKLGQKYIIIRRTCTLVGEWRPQYIVKNSKERELWIDEVEIKGIINE